MEKAFQEIIPDKIIRNQSLLLEKIQYLPTLDAGSLVSTIERLSEVSSRCLHNTWLLGEEDFLIKSLIRVILNPQAGEDLLEVVFGFLRKVVSQIGVSRSSMLSFYQFLASSELSESQIRHSIRFVSEVSTPINYDSPINYFYFSGEGSGIIIKPGSEHPFHSGFACCLWLRLESIPMPLSKLFVFHTDGAGGIEAYLLDNKLYYQITGKEGYALQVSKGEYVCDLPYEEWCFLVITHDRPRFGRAHVKVNLNGLDIANIGMDFPKLKGLALTSAGLFLNFAGQVSGALFFNESLNMSKVLNFYRAYPCSPQTHETLKGMTKTKGFGYKPILLYHPMRAKNRVVYEAMSKLDGHLEGDCGVKLILHNHLFGLGGICSLIPLLSKIKSLETNRSEILEEWLRMLITCMKDRIENQIEACSVSFFKVMAQELEPSIFSVTHIYLLEELSVHLISQLIDQLAIDLLWSVELWKQTSEEVQFEVIELLQSLYASNPRSLFTLMDMQEMLPLLIHHYSGSLVLIQSFTALIQRVFALLREAAVPGLKYLISTLFTDLPYQVVFHLLNVIKALLSDPQPSVFAKGFVEYGGIEMLIHLVISNENLDIKASGLLCLELLLALPVKHSLLGGHREVFGLISKKLFPSFHLTDYPRKDKRSDSESSLEHRRISSEKTFEFFSQDLAFVETDINEEPLSPDEEFHYFSALNLLLCRPENSFDVIDDTEVIKDPSKIQLFIETISKSSLHIKYKASQDLLMLTKWNFKNAITLLRDSDWHVWLLSLLLELPQNLESAVAVFDTGARVHTSALKQAMLQEDQGWRYFERTLLWYENHSHRTNASTLTRNLIQSLANTICLELSQGKSSPHLWKNSFLIAHLLERSNSVEIFKEIVQGTTLALSELLELSRPYSLPEDPGRSPQDNHSKSMKCVEKIYNHFGNVQVEESAAALVRREERHRKCYAFYHKTMKKLKEWRGPWAISTEYNFEPYRILSDQMSWPLLRVKQESNYIRAVKPDIIEDTSQILLDIRVLSEEDLEEEFEEPEELSISTEPSPLAAVLAKDSAIVTVEVSWVLPLTVRYGLLQLIVSKDSQKLRFVYDERMVSQFTSKVELFVYAHSSEKPYSKEWNVQSLRQVIPKTYVMRHRAAEFLFFDGRSVMFNFGSLGERNKFTSQLRKYSKTAVPRSVFFMKPHPRRLMLENDMTEKWVNWKISNFEYLMYLNFMSGRSFNDLTQYPVFPWILTDYSSDEIDLQAPAVFRDLSKNVGSLGPPSRLEKFIKRYSQFGENDDLPPFHFGSHYSNPGIALHYLIRMFPYSEGSKELQGGKFDLPDRLFRCLGSTFSNATDDLSDVRELIPEFFVNPEFLINRQRFEFGITQNNDIVDDIVLPPWANNNPYDFVRIHREALESDYVSANIHNWIDLIFGYKQLGSEAKKACNVFHYMTYENTIDLDKVDDVRLRSSLESQVVYFGKTPSQLFNKPHPVREQRLRISPEPNVLSEFSHLSIFLPRTNTPAILTFRIIKGKEIVCVRENGNVGRYQWWPAPTGDTKTPFTLTYQKDMIIEQGKTEFETRNRSLSSVNYPIYLFNHGKLYVSGGFWDGRLSFRKTTSKDGQSFIWKHRSTVVALDVDRNERVALTGAQDGDLILWEIIGDSWEAKWHYFDHDAAITYVKVSEELNCFASCSYDQTVNLYSIASGKLLRVVYTPAVPSVIVFGSAPPAKFIVFCNQKLISYSVNGDFLREETENCEKINCPSIYRNLNFKEFLIYGTEQGDIVIRHTGTLEVFRKFSLSGNSAVIYLTITSDLRFILAACAGGDITVLTDPESTLAILKKQWLLSSVFQII